MSKTHWRDIHQRNYFGSYCLPDEQDMELTIETVRIEEFHKKHGKRENLPVAYWMEDEKPLIINVNNCQRLEELSGSPHIEDWEGQNVLLYKEPTEYEGEEKMGVRIRPYPPQPSRSGSHGKLTPNHRHWDKVVTGIATGQYTMESARKDYILEDRYAQKIKVEVEQYKEVEGN